MSSSTTLNPELRYSTEASRHHPGKLTAPNVGPLERMISAAFGGLLVTWGVRNRSLSGLAGAATGAELIRRGISGRCMLFRAANINTAVTRKSGFDIAADAPEIRRSITISASPGELCSLFRDPAYMARIVSPFAEVTAKGDGVTHWRVRGPLGELWEWDCNEGEEEMDGARKVSWHSLPGATLPNRGEVTFRPGPYGTGTEVSMRIQFEPPLGRIGTALAKGFHRVPRSLAGQTLRRFKSLVETGEVPTLEHNPSGRGNSDLF
jgi:uncharacterized membrane protein